MPDRFQILALLAFTVALIAITPLIAAAQGISQLKQFTSTTSPAAITQTVFGKAFRLSGQSSGCAQFSANGTLTSTGVSCGTGSGSGFSTTSTDYWFTQQNTSDLTEGSNLYYTAARSLASFISNLAATTSVKSIATLPSLSLPYSQLTGTPAVAGYPFPSNATTTVLTLSNGATIGNNLTLSGITGSTQCLHVNSSGVVSGTGTDCGAVGSSSIGTSTNEAATQVPIWTSTSGTPATLGADNRFAYSDGTLFLSSTDTVENFILGRYGGSTRIRLGYNASKMGTLALSDASDTETLTLLATGASTIPYASTTALSATTLCLSTDCRTAWPSGGSSFDYPFPSNATTSALTLGGLTLTTPLSAANGGSGRSSNPSGNYLIGNGTGAFQNKPPAGVLVDIGGAASGSNSDITSLTGLTATSTATKGFNISGGCYAVNGTCLSTGGGSSFAYPFPSNATSTRLTFSTGLLSLASTTIGDGTAGLTVSGNATTTGDAYFAGNVGIGTNTPAKPFHVEGTTAGGVARIQRDAATAIPDSSYGTLDLTLNELNGLQENTGPGLTFSVQNNGGTGNVLGDIHAVRRGADDTGAVILRSYFGGSPNLSLTVDSGENTVAIASTSPSSLCSQMFCVAQTNGSAGIINVSGTSSPVRSLFTTDINSSISFLGTISNHPLAFITNNTQRMHITAAGDVGIGTTSPQSTLEVDGTLTIQGGPGASNSNFIVQSGDYAGKWATIANAGTGLYSVYDYLNNKTPFNISKNAPNNALNIYTTSVTAGEKFIGNAGIQGTYFQGAGGGAASIYPGNASATANAIHFYGGTGGSFAERMTLNGGGNVGIGTTSPFSIFHVTAPQMVRQRAST